MKFITLLAVFLAGCSTYKHGIPNFSQVAPGVYRGGQPDAKGFKYLESLGVNRVVKLNEGADATTIDVITVPISLERQLGLKPIWPGTIEHAVDAMTGVVYVHCEHGQDRTGLAIAIYRVRICGWSKEKAESEMLAHGFHTELAGLWKYWKEFQP